MSKTISFNTQECTDKNCLFRFPLMEGNPPVNICPKCGAPSKKIGNSYPRHHISKGNLVPHSLKLHVLLDNIRSLYNVGSVFRTAEAVGVRQLHLCGITPTPNNPRLAKTSIGAEKTLAWQYHNNGLIAARNLQKQGFVLWAIEGGEKATPLFETDITENKQKIVLIIGNELAGIDPGILEICEQILYIPMSGQKESLNLTVAFGIAAYYLGVFQML